MSTSSGPGRWRPRVLRPGALLAVAIVATLVPLFFPDLAWGQGGIVPEETLKSLKESGWNDGILDRTSNRFLEGQHLWAAAAVKLATPIYVALAVLELIISGYGWAMKSESPDVILRELARKCLMLSFGFVLLNNHSMFLTPVVRGLGDAGACIGRGLSSDQCGTMSPSEIMGRGFGMSLRIGFGIFAPAPKPKVTTTPSDPTLGERIVIAMEKSAEAMVTVVDAMRRLVSFVTGGPVFLVALCVVLLAALAVLLAFTLIAAQLFKTAIEAAVVLGVGVFLLGFAGSRITAGMAEGFAGYAVETGMRFFMLNAIVGIGSSMIPGWQTQVNSAFRPDLLGGDAWWLMPNYAILLEVALGAALFAYLAYSLPNRFASVATQKLSFGLQQAMSS